MSRPNPNYDSSFWGKFDRWVHGTYDPTEGTLETNPPEGKRKPRLDLGKLSEYDESRFEKGLNRRLHRYNRINRVLFVLVAVFMITLLLWTVSYLPEFGDPNAPENNEVAKRYIEQGLEETGSMNIVTGMILDYRAFDTFGESCVLFVAACCVLILLRIDREEEPEVHAVEQAIDMSYEPLGDTILQQVANILSPMIVIFGIYVILNGHLSPGGGFSGGAIIATGLILYLTAHGFEQTERFLNERVIQVLTVAALSFYCFAKAYSFYTGANGLESFIGTGTPGNLFSAGLIVYLNICVGIVVACTMYSFYTLFRKGGI